MVDCRQGTGHPLLNHQSQVKDHLSTGFVFLMRLLTRINRWTNNVGVILDLGYSGGTTTSEQNGSPPVLGFRIMSLRVLPWTCFTATKSSLSLDTGPDRETEGGLRGFGLMVL